MTGKFNVELENSSTTLITPISLDFDGTSSASSSMVIPSNFKSTVASSHPEADKVRYGILCTFAIYQAAFWFTLGILSSIVIGFWAFHVQFNSEEFSKCGHIKNSNLHVNFTDELSKEAVNHNDSFPDYLESSSHEVDLLKQNITPDCITPICMKAAGRILARLNPTANPCEDFYSFTCGKFLEENEIPDDNFQRSTLQEMQQSILVDIKKLIDQPLREKDGMAIKKAKKLYTSCMHGSFRTSHFTDYKDLPIYSVLSPQGVGHWPILRGKKWKESEYNLENLMAQLFSHQVQSIFELYVTTDELEPNKYLLQFYRGAPAMAKAFFLNTTNPDYMKYFRSYKRLMLESILILSQGSPTASVEVDLMLKFETQLTKVNFYAMALLNGLINEKKTRLLVHSSRCHFDGVDLDYPDEEEDTGRVLVGEIKYKLPQTNDKEREIIKGIDWALLIQNIFDNLGIERNVTGDMPVYIHCSEYFPRLFTLIDETDKRIVTNYLIWRFVFRYMPFLGNKFLQIWMEFMKDVPDTNEEKLYLSRWKQCASIVNDGFGMAVAYLFVQKNHDKRATEKVEEMIAYLKKAFSTVIQEQFWLPEYFKESVIEKLTKMGKKIGYPHHILDPSALDKEYSGLDFNETYFLMNILKLRKYEVYREIKKVNRPVDKERDWVVQPLVANAFHNPGQNEIVIPLGMLRYPMFNEDYPMYLNFANLGIVIAHEQTHGFDHQGRHYDKNGNFSMMLWPEEVMSSFKTQAICFADQYARFKMPVVNVSLDGNETLADNMCDNAALRHAWLAYKMWVDDHGSEAPLPGINFTIPQLFYINYGQIWCEVLNKEGYEQYVRDIHSPGQFRTTGVAQNNKHFGDIFSCPVGSRMNPKEKCLLWS